MSVAISRPPITNHYHSNRMPPSSSTIVPGLIRLQGTIASANKSDSSPSRYTRSKHHQRKHRPNKQSQGASEPAAHAPELSGSASDGAGIDDNLPTNTLSGKEHSSPAGRGPQLQQSQKQPREKLRQPHQNQQSASMVGGDRRQPPRTPTRAKHQRPQHADLSLSSADDSDSAPTPDVNALTPARSRPRALKPKAKTNPNASSSPERSRPASSTRRTPNKQHNQSNNKPNPSSAGAPDLLSPPTTTLSSTFSSTPPLAILTTRNLSVASRARNRGRSASTNSTHFSRSVPVDSTATRPAPALAHHAHSGGLPDWDLPASFSGFSSGSARTESSGSDSSLATERPDPFSFTSRSIQSQGQSAPLDQLRTTTPTPPTSEERFLIPWVETLEDERERAAAMAVDASASLSKLPNTSSRPARVGVRDLSARFADGLGLGASATNSGRASPALARTTSGQFPIELGHVQSNASYGINGMITPVRPGRRHARTASVPSFSTIPSPGSGLAAAFSSPSNTHIQASASGTELSSYAHTITSANGGGSGAGTPNSNKYAGGRFQSAPAPGFLPMPSFQA